MSDIIQLLPDAVANQIAAGEVIQRPASVVKELVENAIDAGATDIRVVLKDAGRTLIQVIDNGKGMSPTDARLAFERHATSKIKCADDLFALRTMGFRGEALASIAAIAHVDLRTRRAEDELGTYLSVVACKVESQEAVSTPVGSNFSIKNIFFNVPARRKFLKSNQVEISNINAEFERISLVHTDISFSLIHNDCETYNLPPSTLRSRIVALYGKSLNTQLLSVEVDTSLVKIEGYIGKPESARKRGALQYFFVNGRYMRHPYFHKAISSCYEPLIPVGEMPHYFLNFTVDPATIDVNIHPTKTEIKFENEQPIWQIISAAVKESLGKFNAVPSIDFDMDDAPDIPVFSSNAPIKPPQVSFSTSYNPFKTAPSTGSHNHPEQRDWGKLYEGFESRKNEDLFPDETVVTATSGINKIEETLEVAESQLTIPTMCESKMNHSTGVTYLQSKAYYVFTSVKSGVMIIDQHRAHVRILFDRYMAMLNRKEGVSQRLLFPEMIYFSASEDAVLHGMKEDLSALGFDFSDMGNHAYAINGVPSGIDGVQIENLLRKMIDTVSNRGGDIKYDLHEAIALSMAQSTAIPYGQILSNEEMDQLVSDLFACTMPNFTPDGKPVVSILSFEEITKRFTK